TLVWPTFGTSLSYSESNFRDVTTRSNDLDTTSINGGLNFLLFSSMALQVGGTQTTINNLTTSDLTTTVSGSLNVNYQIVPNQYTIGMWGGYTQRSDNFNLTNNTNTSTTIELSWHMSQTANLTLGYNILNYNDLIYTTSSYKDSAVSARANIGF